MKSTLFAAATVAALSAAGLTAPALAQSQLQRSAMSGIVELGFESTRVGVITEAQAAQIQNVLSSGDSDSTKISRVEQILGISAAAPLNPEAGADQLRASVSADMASLGMDTSGVASLSTEQLLQIENVTSSSDSPSLQVSRIEEITGMSERAAGSPEPGTDQVRASVKADMASMGMDTSRVDLLTGEQLAEIQNVTGSSDDTEQKKSRIELIMAE